MQSAGWSISTSPRHRSALCCGTAISAYPFHTDVHLLHEYDEPADLYPAWKWIDIMEQRGGIEAGEARR